MDSDLYRTAQLVIGPGEAPSIVHYAEFQRAFTFYNDSLFQGRVPECLIVMTRKPRSHGYLHPSKWKSAETGDVLHELGLNPLDFAGRSTEQVLSTLVHEMTYAWQMTFGQKPPRRGYHNKEWASKMEEVGLIPSNTGQPGGKQTGQSMTHYIDDTGEFYRQTARLLDLGWVVPHIDLPEAKKTRKIIRPKYVCIQCGIQAWGKSGLVLRCGTCEEAMKEESPEGEQGES